MAVEMTYNVKDIPHCARYGFSLRKIWVFFRSILLSWFIWDFSVYLGYFASGSDLAARFHQSRLLPLPGSLFWMDPIPVIILVIGSLMIVYVLMKASLMVSKMTFQQIRGDNFFSSSDAASFGREHAAPLISIPVMLSFTLLLIYGIGALSGLISKIPAAGPVAVSILAIPLWGVMLLGILTAIALFLSIGLLPAIIACTGGDSFESIFEVFSTLTSQSWRLLLYWILSMIVILLTGAVFILFSSAAFSLLSLSVSAGAADGGFIASLASGPQALAPEVLPFFSGILTFGQHGDVQSWTGLAGVLAALSGTAIILILTSYFLSGISSAWTLIYLVLKYRKDGDDLLDRADKEEQREFDLMYGDTDSEKP